MGGIKHQVDAMDAIEAHGLKSQFANAMHEVTRGRIGAAVSGHLGGSVRLMLLHDDVLWLVEGQDWLSDFDMPVIAHSFVFHAQPGVFAKIVDILDVIPRSFRTVIGILVEKLPMGILCFFLGENYFSAFLSILRAQEPMMLLGLSSSLFSLFLSHVDPKRVASSKPSESDASSPLVGRKCWQVRRVLYVT